VQLNLNLFFAALVAAWWIKPRKGRYDNGLKPLPINDGVIAISGLFMLWFAWLSFNSGSSFGITGGKWEFAARAAVCTTIASISSGFTALILSMITHKGRTDVSDMINGVLSGLGVKFHFRIVNLKLLLISSF
jgi:ammonium transporter, Amt family